MAIQAIQAGIVILGSALQLSANSAARKEKRAAARRAAAAAEENARLIELVGSRELDIFNRESNLLYSQQYAFLIKSGVDISGSAQDLLAQTEADIGIEHDYMVLNTSNKAKLARLQGTLELEAAAAATSGSVSFMQDFGTLLGGATDIMSVFAPKEKTTNSQGGVEVAGMKGLSVGNLASGQDANRRRSIMTSMRTDFRIGGFRG